MHPSESGLGGWALGDVTHLPMLVVPLMAAGAALARERRRTSAATASRAAWLWLLALASANAAVVHAAVAPEHFGESTLYGAFFLGTTVAGLAYAVIVLMRPTRPVLVTGLVGNASIVALWLFTRLVEVPVGPGAGETEAFGVLDIVASSAELLCVAVCVRLLLSVSGQRASLEPMPRRDVVSAVPALRSAQRHGQ